MASFYVLDGYGTSLILHYNARGELQHVFGGRGKAPGSVNEAHGGDHRPARPGPPHPARHLPAGWLIKRFGLDGKYLGEIALPNTLPCNIVFTERGDVYPPTPDDGSARAPGS